MGEAQGKQVGVILIWDPESWFLTDMMGAAMTPIPGDSMERAHSLKGNKCSPGALAQTHNTESEASSASTGEMPLQN